MECSTYYLNKSLGLVIVQLSYLYTIPSTMKLHINEAKQITHPQPPSGGPGSSSKGTSGPSFSSSKLVALVSTKVRIKNIKSYSHNMKAM